jgi:hypothetical protein
MSEFVAGPLLVEDAPDYTAYNTSVLEAMRQLSDEGRLPGLAALDEFLDVSERIRRAVTAAASRASQAGQSEFSLAVPMTKAEHRTMEAMGPSLQAVLEIATMRGTVDTKPPPGAFRFMGGLGRGQLRE